MGRPVRVLTIVSGLVLGALGGCDGQVQDRIDPPPTLPPLELHDVLPSLQAIVAAAPTGPDEARLAQLRELIEAAFVPGYADERVSARAARALDDEADIEWAFEQALTHEATTVRAQCAWQLGQRGRVAALPLLLLRLKDEKDQGVRCWLVDAITRLGSLGTLEELVDAMATPESSQVAFERSADLLRLLGRDPGGWPLPRELIAALREVAARWRADGRLPDGLQTVPDLAAASIAAMDPLLAARLASRLVILQEFQLRGVDETRYVFRRLGRIGLPLLAAPLHAREPYLRSHSVEIVHDLGPVAGGLGAELLPLLADDLTASVAARGLGRLGYAPALPHLLARLTDASVEVRASAAAALGPLGDAAAREPLRARMLDEAEEMDVRVQAAASLGGLDEGAAFLRARLTAGDYHAPTVRELLDSLMRPAASH